MRARHRVSKLLLRHGIVYSGGKAWTATHAPQEAGQEVLAAPSQQYHRRTDRQVRRSEAARDDQGFL